MKCEMGKLITIFFLASVMFVFLSGCASTQGSYTPSKHMKDDIQYRSAYKYDIKGKKYRKHFKKQEKRNKKK
jgi:hypothetical protein